jgi:hypothetical protein
MSRLTDYNDIQIRKRNEWESKKWLSEINHNTTENYEKNCDHLSKNGCVSFACLCVCKGWPKMHSALAMPPSRPTELYHLIYESYTWNEAQDFAYGVVIVTGLVPLNSG